MDLSFFPVTFLFVLLSGYLFRIALDFFINEPKIFKYKLAGIKFHQNLEYFVWAAILGSIIFSILYKWMETQVMISCSAWFNGCSQIIGPVSYIVAALELTISIGILISCFAINYIWSIIKKNPIGPKEAIFALIKNVVIWVGILSISFCLVPIFHTLTADKYSSNISAPIFITAVIPQRNGNYEIVLKNNRELPAAIYAIDANCLFGDKDKPVRFDCNYPILLDSAELKKGIYCQTKEDLNYCSNFSLTEEIQGAPYVYADNSKMERR